MTKPATCISVPYHLPETMRRQPSNIIGPDCVPMTMGEVVDLLNDPEGDDEMAELQNENNELEDKLSRLESEVDDKDDEIAALEKQVAALEDRLEAIESGDE